MAIKYMLKLQLPKFSAAIFFVGKKEEEELKKAEKGSTNSSMSVGTKNF